MVKTRKTSSKRKSAAEVVANPGVAAETGVGVGDDGVGKRQRVDQVQPQAESALGIVLGQVNLTPGSILVDENNPVTLTCTYTGTGTVVLFDWKEVVGDVGGSDDRPRGNIVPSSCSPFTVTPDSTKYNYSCTGNKQMSWTIKNINRSNDGDRWACIVTVQGTLNSNAASIGVRVPIKSVSMILPNSDATVNVVENTKLEFRCQTDGGLPVADITWYKDNGTPGTTSDDILIQQNITPTQAQNNGLYVRTSTLSLYPPRSDGDNRIYCSATNSEDQTPLISTLKPKLNVQFAPSTPTIHYDTISGSPIIVNPFNVVAGDNLPVACIADGHPEPHYTWEFDNAQYTGQRVVLSSFDRDTVDTTIECTAQNELQETGATAISKSNTTTVTVNIMYPPYIPNIRLKYESGTNTDVSHTFSVLEGAAFVLDCEGSSKPDPLYQWLGSGAKSSSEIHVPVDATVRDGVYTYMCEVKNQMSRTYGSPTKQEGRNSANVTANILYGPEVSHMSDLSAEEFETFRYNCPYTPGNPTDTTVKWTRAIDRREWNSDMLEIVNVTKDDRMRYTCTVENTMYPTNLASVTDPKSGSLYLDVKYKASIAIFILEDYINNEVDEFTSPTLSCSVDSNPVSNIKILFQNKTLVEDASTLQLKHQLSNVSCGDIGVYTCTGRNYLNVQAPQTQDVILLVKCRPQPFGDIAYTVYSAQRNPATLSLLVLGYPDKSPSVVWKQGEIDLKNNAQLTMTVNHVKSTKTYIDIIHLNLTIHNVTKSDFGQYKVMIRNNVGMMEKTFYLMAEDKPESPTEFGLISSLMKTTEATIQWKPGFNGGPNQTFVLLYKKPSDIEWIKLYINETGDVKINYTLTHLESNTPYIVKIYAQNRVGNSSISDDVTIHTLEIADPPGGNIGMIVGGVVGGILFAGLVVLALVLLIRRQRGWNSNNHESNSCDHTDANKPTNSEDVSYYNVGRREEQVNDQSNSDATYYNEARVPEYEMLNQQNRDFTTYSSLQSGSNDLNNDISSGEEKTYENLKLQVLK